MKTIYIYWRLDDEVKNNFLSQLTNEAVEPPNHKTYKYEKILKHVFYWRYLFGFKVNILDPFDFSV